QKSNDEGGKNAEDDAHPGDYGGLRHRSSFEQCLFEDVPAQRCADGMELATVRAHGSCHKRHEKQCNKPLGVKNVDEKRYYLVNIATYDLYGKLTEFIVEQHICERSHSKCDTRSKDNKE